MSVDEFFATAPAPVSVAPVAPPISAGRRHGWRVVVAVVAGLALATALVVTVWPHPSGPTGPDPATARLFGQGTRSQLPQPVTADDCMAAVAAFPGISRDSVARAAFIDGCLHGG